MNVPTALAQRRDDGEEAPEKSQGFEHELGLPRQRFKVSAKMLGCDKGNEGAGGHSPSPILGWFLNASSL
ncbi:MAG: hypothetical protein JRH20_01970 [Deltaproteobacteria bacterium]|nr:hypothetical protein [Deltaproteobacteria bacterium]